MPRRLPAAGWGQLLSVCRLRSRRHWKGIRTLGAITGWRAEPEAKLRFDNFAGEPRNSDIAATCRDPNGDYLLAVEAKADESFGETIERSLAAALERRIANNRSNALSRIQQLTEALFEPKRKGEPKLGTLRYQLLTACAGALCEAERLGFDRALMLVQEFVTDETDDRKHRANAIDLDEFVSRLSHLNVTNVRSGEIYGPFGVPGLPLLEATPRLYIGKVSRTLRSSA